MAELIPLVALWENKSKQTGKPYWSGKLGEAKVLMFRQKSDNPKAPAFKIFVGEAASTWKDKDDEATEPGPDEEFPEIPF